VEGQLTLLTVADPDLEMGGRGAHLEPEKWGDDLEKPFSALRVTVWSKDRGGPPLDRSLIEMPLSKQLVQIIGRSSFVLNFKDQPAEELARN